MGEADAGPSVGRDVGLSDRGEGINEVGVAVVGAPLGYPLTTAGLADGSFVGPFVGVWLGASDGMASGVIFNDAIGPPEEVGGSVGGSVGGAVGGVRGIGVGGSVGGVVGGVVGLKVGRSVGAMVGFDVGSVVAVKVGKFVSGNSVSGQLGCGDGAAEGTPVEGLNGATGDEVFISTAVTGALVGEGVKMCTGITVVGPTEGANDWRCDGLALCWAP